MGVVGMAPSTARECTRGRVHMRLAMTASAPDHRCATGYAVIAGPGRRGGVLTALGGGVRWRADPLESFVADEQLMQYQPPALVVKRSTVAVW